jgi:hypothetical protein
MSMNPDKARAVQLSYKRSTQGLSEQEKRELDELSKRMAMENRMAALKPQDDQG